MSQTRNAQAIGVLALGRPTFDVPFAEAVAAQAFAALDAAGIKTVGPRGLLFDAAAAKAALADVQAAGARKILLLQVTFTDASMTVEVAHAVTAPLALWAFPEPRAGGRLRLNSFCGLNLALHALGRAGKQATYLYSAPDAANIASGLVALLSGAPRTPPGAADHAPPSTAEVARAEKVVKALNGMHIGLVGERPAGFDTCRFEDRAIADLAGVGVLRIGLDDVFARAKSANPARVAASRQRVAQLAGIDEVDQPQLDRSLRVYEAFQDIATAKGCDALAVRCWPEMFTEYGCAACGPMGLLNGAKLPAACEADVYGALTQRLLQDLAGEPAWLVDIVDMDAASDTGVLWHCGSAPLSMCDPQYKAEAQIHSNRKMPLLAQFPLKPGRITLARITQARNETRMIVGGGEVLRAPISFTGTSAVVRFDGGTEAAMRGLLDHALEHHLAIVYGDHRGAVRAAGRHLGLDVVALA
jgi:L-fucose isomerase-like protein